MSTTSTEASASKKIVIVGAGIVGVSTAIWCQRKGHDVTLLDRAGPAAGASYGNAGVLAACSVVPVTVPGLMGKAPGLLMNSQSPLFMRWRYVFTLLPWLRKYLKHCNDDDVARIAAALTPILQDSLQQHQDLSAGTGAEQYVHPSDYLFVYRNREEYLADSYGWDVRRTLGYTWDELDSQALMEFDKQFVGGSAGFAAKVGNHGRIGDPGQYVATLAQHFVAQGGQLSVGSVEDFQQLNGRVSGVVTEENVYPCDCAVLATGAWSPAITKKLGVTVPVESERGYHIELVNPSVMPRSPSMIAAGKFVATPMDGRLRCAGIVEFGGLTDTRSDQPLALLKQHIHTVFPGIQYDSIDEWLGFRPAPTDSVPLIGEFDALPGIYGGFGHQHVGLTGGPKTGRLLASLISGEPTGIDMAPYRTDRFA